MSKRKQWMTSAVLLIGVFTSTACGKAASSTPATPTPASSNTSSTTTTTPAAASTGQQCVPLNQLIPLSGQNVTVNYNPADGHPVKIVVGTFPAGIVGNTAATFGTLSITGQPASGDINRNAPSAGIISLSIKQGTSLQPVPNGNGALTSQGSLLGTLQISDLAQRTILEQVQNGGIQIPGLSGTTGTASNLPTTQTPKMLQPQDVCVSGVAINGGTLLTQQVYAFYGDVYLYLNNTKSGYVLKF